MHDAELDRDLIAHNLRAEVFLHADEPPAVAARDDLVCQELLRDVLDALAVTGRGEEVSRDTSGILGVPASPGPAADAQGVEPLVGGSRTRELRCKPL
jgi:hypothetical protein